MPEIDIEPAPKVDAAAVGRAVVDLLVGESLQVGRDVKVTVVAKSGRLARLVVCAPRDQALKKLPE